MDAAEEPQALAASICPKCHLGELTKHCDPENRCGWWSCEFECGYGVSLVTGVALANLSRRHRSVDSGRGDGDQEDA